MTSEQLLLTAIGSVTTALIFVCRILWSRSEQCERDRIAMRIEIEAVKVESGERSGLLKAYERCPEKECPFKS